MDAMVLGIDYRPFFGCGSLSTCRLDYLRYDTYHLGRLPPIPNNLRYPSDTCLPEKCKQYNNIIVEAVLVERRPTTKR